MWSKTALALVLVALGILVSESVRASNHEWRQINSSERTILFSPPFMGIWNPGITVRVRDRTASRSEWLCWRDFQSHEANACITYQKQAGRPFPYQTASDALHYYDPLKEIKKTITRKSKKFDHELDAFDTVRFTSNSLGTRKDCVVFSVLLSSRRQAIDGWYCAPVDISLSEPIIQKMISTIGLKGRHEPAKVTYSKLPVVSPTPAPEAAPPGEPIDVQRAWDAAEVLIDLPESGLSIFGKMGHSETRARLARIPGGTKLATIIYLHGCSGLAWEGPFRFWQRVAREGFAIISSKSYVYQPKMCRRSYLRLSEVRFFLDKLRGFTWVDQSNLFLMGSEEGGEFTAYYDGDEFKGKILSGANCLYGVRSSASSPLLAIVASPDYQEHGEACTEADQTVLIDSGAKDLLVFQQAQKAVLGFLKYHATSIGSSKDEAQTSTSAD